MQKLEGSIHFIWQEKREEFGDIIAEKKVIIVINEFKYGQTWKIWPLSLDSKKRVSVNSTLKVT